MTIAEDSFRALLEAEIKRFGNVYAAENALGLPEDSLRSIISPRQGQNRKQGTALNRAKEICDRLGLEFYIGHKRQIDDTPNADMTAFAQIPLHDAMLAAGGGAMNGDAAIIDHLAFRKSWLKRMDVSPNSAVLARASGDSMSPTIQDGDMLLIDRQHQSPPARQRGPKDTRPAPIFALLDDGEARVKRVEKTPSDHWAILSDNPAFAPEFRPLDAVQFIGKVVWWGHTVSDR